jgi:hypothetical protein
VRYRKDSGAKWSLALVPEEGAEAALRAAVPDLQDIDLVGLSQMAAALDNASQSVGQTLAEPPVVATTISGAAPPTSADVPEITGAMNAIDAMVAGGVMLLSPRDAAAAFPMFFPKGIEAAKKTLRRAVQRGDIDRVLVERCATGEDWVLVSYRPVEIGCPVWRPGWRRRPTPARFA